MRFIYYLLIIFILCSCNYELKEQPTQNIIIAENTTISKKDSINIKIYSEVINTPMKVDKSLSMDDIKKAKSFLIDNVEPFRYSTTQDGQWNSFSFSFYKEAKIIDYGNVKIYKATLYNGDADFNNFIGIVLLHNIERSEIVTFYINKLKLIRLQPQSQEYLIGGTTIYRRVGYFHIYSFDDNKFNEVFYIRKDGLLPTYLEEKTLTNFVPYELKFENNDVNNDGWLDIIFKGKVVCSNCEWMKDYPGVADKQSRKVNKITMTYLWDEQEHTWKLQENFDQLLKIINF